MKKFLFIVSLFILQVLSVKSQTSFQKTYCVKNTAFSNTNAIQQTADGGFVLAGTDSSAATQDRDFYLVKTDAAGDTLWSKTYGTTGVDYGQCVIQSNDGGYFVVGTTLSSDWNVFLIKTDGRGDTLWTKIIGGSGDDEANSIQQTTDGGFIICGYTNSFGAGNYDYFLIKVNINGNILWSKAYGTPSDELGYFVQQTKDKGFIVSGAANNAGNSTIDAYAFKTDSSGVMQWSKYYGTLSTDWGYMMRQTFDGGYILAGYLGAGTTTDAFLIRTNNTGDTLWTKTYGGPGYEQALCVTETKDSSYVLSGSVYSNSMGGSDAMLLKTDNKGNLSYCHGFGGTKDDWAPSLVQTPDKGFALGAYSNSLSGGPYNYYLVKTDSSGNSNGGCNQINISLPTTQRAFVAASVVTTVTSFTFAPVVSVTNVDSGVVENSPCISLGNNAQQAQKIIVSLNVYPNPGSGIFNLAAENISSAQVKVSMSNMLGEIVYAKTFQNRTGKINEQINLSVLPIGTYFVSMQSANEARVVKLIISK
ncbi:MAG TPA: T9SS type A sorting domain-containing protein [Bacteroidia bacterium]|nr:T9SS type A sorting domain-containing protein [Bacteroidia bacterium]